MPLSHEEHEALLSQLNNPELSAEDRTEVLTSLRNNYTSSLEEQSTLSSENEKLVNSNNDLLKANAKLFNESGAFFSKDGDFEEQDDEPSISETITLEDMESKYRTH